MQKTKIYKVDYKPSFKKEWSLIEFNGVELLLKKIFGQRGVKNYDLYSTYTSSGDYGQLSLHSLGSQYQMNIEYITRWDGEKKCDVVEHDILTHLMIGENGGLYGSLYGEENICVKFQIEGLER